MCNKLKFKIIQIRSMLSFIIEITRDKRMVFCCCGGYCCLYLYKQDVLGWYTI